MVLRRSSEPAGLTAEVRTSLHHSDLLTGTCAIRLVILTVANLTENALNGHAALRRKIWLVERVLS
jgi:hypothetical protein